MQINPPNCNGIVKLTDLEIIQIKKELDNIKDMFKPNINEGSCTIQYITSQYNINNVGKELNGDTVLYILNTQ